MRKLLILIIVALTLIEAAPCIAQENDVELKARIDKLMQGIVARTEIERTKDKEVQERYKEAIIIDMLIPGTPQGYVGGTMDDYEEMIDLSVNTGFTHVSYTAAIDDTFEPLTIIHWIAKAIKHWQSMPEKYQVVETVDDIYKAKKEGKFGVSINFQGSNALGGNIDMVDIYYKLGVRQMNFAYNVRNFMSDGGGVDPDKDGGLSLAGKRLVKEMNRVGMIVDCTHSSNQTALDASEISTKPIILSHSNPFGAYNLSRNSPDEVIKAVAKTGGIIATNGVGAFLNKDGIASPEEIARHVNYVKELVGAEHTGWGSDYVHPEMLLEALMFILVNPESYPPELGYGKSSQLAIPGDVWGVVGILESKYNWTPGEIKGFLGENALRVYKANWK